MTKEYYNLVGNLIREVLQSRIEDAEVSVQVFLEGDSLEEVQYDFFIRISDGIKRLDKSITQMEIVNITDPSWIMDSIVRQWEEGY